MSDTAVQVVLVALTGLGMLLICLRPPWQLRGYLVMLASQVFWLYATASAGQWGMFLISVFYTVVWIRAIVTSPAQS